MPNEPRDIAASVRARLLNLARERGQEMQRLLVHYALERFLYRLGQSDYSEHFLLKGAMLFHIWEGDLPRATRDLDLLDIDGASETSSLEIFERIWQIQEKQDGLEFDRDSLVMDKIRGRTGNTGLRIKCRIRLGTASIPLQVDIGLGDAVYPSAKRVKYPTLLDFPPPWVLAYPKEAVIAEKIQAMIELGLLNSRLKDYFDVSYLARHQTFEGPILQHAIKSTFERRGTPFPSGSIEGLGSDFAQDPIKQSQWDSFQRRTGVAPKALQEVVEAVREFVAPVIRATANGRLFEYKWPPGGPWKQPT